MGDIKISNNFELSAGKPLDDRFTVATLVARNNITFPYSGLKVYVEETGLYYFWNGSSWNEFTAGGSSTPVSEIVTIASTISGDEADTGHTCSLSVTGIISVIINGLEEVVTGVKTGVFYFSSDGGTTATTSFNGANLFFNQSVAEYVLETTDSIVIKGIS